MPIIEQTNQVGGGLSFGARKVAHATYDFAEDGGAQGDITLTGDSIPSGALVVGGYIETVTALTSGGAATVAVKVEGAADVNAADAISGSPWDAAGVYAADQLVAADDGFKTTADRDIVATVGTADLTAGEFEVIVEYFELA